MDKGLFRRKSLERVSSPEQLNDYIRVLNPTYWTVLGAVILLFIGVTVWGAFGHLRTIEKTRGLFAGGQLTCFVADPAGLEPGLPVKVGPSTGSITAIANTPLSAQAAPALYGEYNAYALDLPEWSYPITVAVTGLADGVVYDCSIILDSASPLSFLLN